jgi:hypothetical protein
VLQALKSFEAATPGVLAALRQVHAELARIESVLSDKVAATAAPDFVPLRSLARCLHAAAEQAGGEAAAAAEPDAAAAPGVADPDRWARAKT